MDYEKKYKEALEKMKGYMLDKHGCTTLIPSDIFPELKESEDERIRTRLIALVEAFGKGKYKDEMLAYLEKQKEVDYLGTKISFPAAYSVVSDAGYVIILKKEYEEYLDDIRQYAYNKGIVDAKQKSAEWSDSVAKEMFIKALERAVEQTKKGYELSDCDKHSWWEDFKAYSGINPAEWSEEDEGLIDLAVAAVEDFYDERNPIRVEIINRLKSLRPQPHWKSPAMNRWKH